MRLLRLEAPSTFRFAAGQYVEVVHPDGRIPLSIASAPWRLPEIHLHYRSTPGVTEAQWMDALLECLNDLDIAGPSGSIRLEAPPPGPLVIVSGGTGGAQAWSLIDTLTKTPPDWPVGFLWCADDEPSLYLRDELRAMRLPWLHFEFVVDASRSADNRAMARLRDLAPGFSSLLGEIAGDSNDIPKPQVLLAGSPGFVYAATDVLLSAGLQPEQIRSDVYDYAPRT